MYFCTNLVGTVSSEAFGGKVIREASPESLCATASASASLKAHPNDHSQQALQLLRHDVAGVLAYFAVYCDFRYQPCMCRGERHIRADFPDRFRSLDVLSIRHPNLLSSATSNLRWCSGYHRR